MATSAESIQPNPFPPQDGSSSLEKANIVTQVNPIESAPTEPSPVANGNVTEPSDDAVEKLSSDLEKTAVEAPHSPPPTTSNTTTAESDDSDEQGTFSEDVKKQLVSVLIGGGNTPAVKSHMKFLSAETEANTNANSYFGSSINSPISTPLIDGHKHANGELEGSSDVSDIEDAASPHHTPRSRTPGRAARLKIASRSNSRGVHDREHRVRDSRSPSAAFEHRVAFDTFDNKNATDFSLTLQSKHEDYQYSRLSRTFLCGTDKNKYSENAVTWLLEQLAEDGDEIVCLRVIDPNSKISTSDKARDEKRYRDEANAFLEHIMTKNTKDKKISLVLEFAIGGVESLIKRMIQIYEPSILVVGTKGRSREGFKGLLPGSVSKWCLQHSPIPVVVVKPKDKRANQKAKREANPNKLAYLDLIAGHPDEATKVYPSMSSSNLLPPQIPIYLRQHSISNSTASLLTTASAPNLEAVIPTQTTQTERLGRFDRLRSRSRSPLPPAVRNES